MRTSVLVAGAVAILAAGAATPALARDNRAHVLTVQLPDGAIEQIHYYGDVAPRVVVLPTAAMAAIPVMADPFAAMERISALMDQQAEAILRQVEALPTGPVSSWPSASGTSFVSTMSGSGVCTRSVQISYNGRDAVPRVVFKTSGDCGSDRRQQAPAEINVPAPSLPSNAAPRVIEARSAGQTGGVPVRQVALAR